MYLPTTPTDPDGARSSTNPPPQEKRRRPRGIAEASWPRFCASITWARALSRRNVGAAHRAPAHAIEVNREPQPRPVRHRDRAIRGEGDRRVDDVLVEGAVAGREGPREKEVRPRGQRDVRRQ